MDLTLVPKPSLSGGSVLMGISLGIIAHHHSQSGVMPQSPPQAECFKLISMASGQLT